MQPRNKRPPAGFSLLEVLLAVSLLVIICAIGFGFCIRYEQRYQVQMEGSNLTSAGDRAINSVLAELRMAGYPAAPGADPFALFLFPAAGGVAYNGVNDNLVATGFNLAGPPAVQLAAGFLPVPDLNPTSVTFEAALGNTAVNTLGVTAPVVDQVQYALVPMSAAQWANCIRNPPPNVRSLWTLERAVAVKGANGAPGAVTTQLMLDHVASPTVAAPTIFTFYDGADQVTALPAQVAQVRVAFSLQTCSADRANNLPVTENFSGVAYVRNLSK